MDVERWPAWASQFKCLERLDASGALGTLLTPMLRRMVFVSVRRR